MDKGERKGDKQCPSQFYFADLVFLAGVSKTRQKKGPPDDRYYDLIQAILTAPPIQNKSSPMFGQIDNVNTFAVW